MDEIHPVDPNLVLSTDILLCLYSKEHRTMGAMMIGNGNWLTKQRLALLFTVIFKLVIFQKRVEDIVFD